MFTQRKPRRRSPIRRGSALATGVITALAIAAPAAQASTASHPAGTTGRAVAIGPSLRGDVFNGSVVIVTSPSPVVATLDARTN
jgi:hypothetical protein